MHPILFEIPGLGFPVRSFGVMLALGFLLGSHILSRLVAKHSSDPARDVERYGAIPVWVLVGLVSGARLMYVVVEVARGSDTGHSYLANPLKILAVWEGGLVMYGGYFGALVGGMWCARRHGLRVYHAADLGAVAGFFGQAVGRVGCLLVGDDYGSIVPKAWEHLPFPLTVRVPNPLPEHSLFGAENAGQLLWATQPMMSIKALIVASLGLWLLKRRRYEGQVALTCLLTYSVLRFTVELFRGDAVRGVWFQGRISTSQMIALVSGSLALALLARNWRRRDEIPAT
ncbi:MAG: prolipoprotein diacylglyceryl transferase [Planctomycetes bacterium]|nr:prolipoprotein diacylglyceryl transferase [Planctomycetota bacterium]